MQALRNVACDTGTRPRVMPALNLSVITRKNRSAKGRRAKYRHLRRECPRTSGRIIRRRHFIKHLLTRSLLPGSSFSTRCRYVSENCPNHRRQLGNIESLNLSLLSLCLLYLFPGSVDEGFTIGKLVERHVLEEIILQIHNEICKLFFFQQINFITKLGWRDLRWRNRM